MQNLQILSFCSAVKYTHHKHTHSDFSSTPRPCHNLAFMLDGEGIIQTGDITLHIKKGDVLFIPKNSTYTAVWKATPSCVYHSIHFNFILNNDPFATKNVPVQILQTDDFENMYKAVECIQQHQYSTAPHSYLYLSAFYQLCGTLFPQVITQKISATDTSITPALNYIHSNYTKHCTVEELAMLCHLSPSRFYYLFKQHTGYSPIAYKNRLAIQNASHALLLGNNSIETIAEEYGFESPIYFRRLFKKILGTTPTAYRKQAKLM